MPDIAAFITARLDEDVQRWKTIWRFQAGDRRVGGWWDLGGTFGRLVNSLVDTTRGGREVAAKRAILALHMAYDEPDDALKSGHCWLCHTGASIAWGNIEVEYEPWPCRTVRLLAASHADHPDFDPGWRIDA